MQTNAVAPVYFTSVCTDFAPSNFGLVLVTHRVSHMDAKTSLTFNMKLVFIDLAPEFPNAIKDVFGDAANTIVGDVRSVPRENTAFVSPQIACSTWTAESTWYIHGGCSQTSKEQ